MKIAYHHRTRGLLAEGIHIRAIVEAFRKLGCHVDLLSLTAGAPGTTVLQPTTEASRAGHFAHKVLEALLPIVYNVPGILYLTFRLVRGQYDFLYERYALYNVSGWVASRVAGIPLVLEVNSPYAHEVAEYATPLFPSLARWTERFVLRRAETVLTVSQVQRDYLVSLGAAADRTHVIPNGVDFDRFDHRKTGESVRNSLGLEDRKVVGFIGSLRTTHGIEIVLEALSRIGDDRPTFLVVGEGKDRQAIEDAVGRHGLDRVIFTGGIPHEEAPGYIAAMDIALKPTSNFYCCPLKILEYMAMKVPVIAGYSPSVAEVIEDGVTGRIIATEADAFRDAIDEMIHAPEQAEAMATSAFHSIRDRSWIAIAERILGVMGHDPAPDRGSK